MQIILTKTQPDTRSYTIKITVALILACLLNPAYSSENESIQNISATQQPIVKPKNLITKVNSYLDPTLLSLYENNSYKNTQKEPVMMITPYLNKQPNLEIEGIITLIHHVNSTPINRPLALGLNDKLETLIPLLIYWELTNKNTSNTTLIQHSTYNLLTRKKQNKTPLKLLNTWLQAHF